MTKPRDSMSLMPCARSFGGATAGEAASGADGVHLTSVRDGALDGGVGGLRWDGVRQGGLRRGGGLRGSDGMGFWEEGTARLL